ncbi:MAG: vWA domain-containing protein [Verrucomicrobiota bacterium]
MLCTEYGAFDVTCIGEVTPIEEVGLVACNGIDDNCDGVADTASQEKLNLIFAFDVSGSMIEEFPYVTAAIVETAPHYNSENVQLGLIVFPGEREGADRHLPYEIIPLAPYDTFVIHLEILDGLLQVLNSGYGGTQECSWDIPQTIVDGLVVQQPDTAPLYDSSARTVIVLFTDEPGQSYLPDENTEESMCVLLDETGVLLYTVTTSLYSRDYDNCGVVLELTSNAIQTAQQLAGITATVCQAL